jgi:hypothetical protein
MNKKILRLLDSVGKFLHTQFFITLVSLPLLIGWGIPVSIMTFVSNLCFTPFLMIFLLLSSLVFFSELVGIPNSLLVQALELYSSAIYTLLQNGSNSWLISFSKPSLVHLCAIAVSAFAVVHLKGTHSRWKTNLYFFVLYSVVGCYLTYWQRVPTTDSPLRTIHVEIINDTNALTIIDTGLLAKHLNNQDWIEYTLLPYLNSSYGKTQIDHFVSLQLSTRALQMLQVLCKQAIVKNIYIPYWQGTGDRKFLKAYYQLKQTMSQHRVHLRRIGTRSVTLTGAHTMLNIDPVDKTISYRGITFPCFCITGVNYNTTIELYSAKYKTMKH